MTQKRVADDVMTTFARRQHDWMERVMKGSLDPQEVSQAVQRIIDRGKLFDPNTYFKDRKGLWVLDSFHERILSKVGPMPYRGLEGVTSKDLPRNMCDKEIVDWFLGGMEEVCNHSFSLDQIAMLIDRQPNGEDGKLLNNGDVNIFYVLVGGVLFAVSVRWNLGHREWRVGGWHLDENSYWGAGGWVFRNTTLVI